MSSYGESKAMDLATNNKSSQWVLQNQWMLSRTYPAGRRTQSDNYNPSPLWSAGVQIGMYVYEDIYIFVCSLVFKQIHCN